MFLPGRPCPTISTFVDARAAQREDNDRDVSGVHELSSHRWADASNFVDCEFVFCALDDQGQLAVEHHVNLFLALMGVNPSSLPGLQHDRVDPERLDAKLAPKSLKALRVVAS